MAERTDVALYNALLDAFRERPGNYSHAARRTGVTRRRAKRGWLIGWIDEDPDFRPIRDVLADEGHASAKALRTRQAEAAARVRISGDELAEQAVAEEAYQLLTARAAATAALEQADELTLVVHDLVERIVRELRERALDPSVPVDEALRIVNGVIRLSDKAAALAQRIMRMERLHRGDAEQTIGVQSKRKPIRTPAEAEQAVADALAARERYLKRLAEGPRLVASHGTTAPQGDDE